MDTPVTIILTESEVPKLKNKKNPWDNPPQVTPAMKEIVDSLIDPAKTNELIKEVEGSPCIQEAVTSFLEGML